MDKKDKKRMEVLQQKIGKLQQLLAAAKKQPDDPAEAPRLEKELAAAGIELLVPLLHQGETKGVLGLGRKMRGGDYTPSEGEFLASLGTGDTRRARLASAFDALHARGGAQFRRLWEGLGALPGVTRYGPGPDRPRTPTIAFTVDGYDSEAVTRALVRRGVFTSHGDFYAATIVERLGRARDGLVRAGAACYTSDDEIERLIDGVAALAS